MNRDISSGHSRRKWKWLKMIFGFLKKRHKDTSEDMNLEERCWQIKTLFLCAVRGIRSMAEGHIHSPGYKTLEHLVVLADKLNEARGRHSEDRDNDEK